MMKILKPMTRSTASRTAMAASQVCVSGQGTYSVPLTVWRVQTVPLTEYMPPLTWAPKRARSSNQAKLSPPRGPQATPSVRTGRGREGRSGQAGRRRWPRRGAEGPGAGAGGMRVVFPFDDVLFEILMIGPSSRGRDTGRRRVARTPPLDFATPLGNFRRLTDARGSESGLLTAWPGEEECWLAHLSAEIRDVSADPTTGTCAQCYRRTLMQRQDQGNQRVMR